MMKRARMIFAIAFLLAIGYVLSPWYKHAKYAAPIPEPIEPASPVRIGLNVNPFANEAITDENRLAKFEMAYEAGISILGDKNATWPDMEPAPGEYRFHDLDVWSRIGDERDMPVAYNLRWVDTNNLLVPSGMAGVAINDATLETRMMSLIDAMLPHCGASVKYIMIGNEVDSYLKEHPGDTGRFTQIVAQARERIQTIRPDIQVSATITFGGLEFVERSMTDFVDQSEFIAMTYYPMRGDFTFRPPGCVEGDFKRMFQFAGSKKILLQEAGYSSSELNRSSERNQASFIAHVLNLTALNPDRFIGVNFFLMSDFPDSLIKQFEEYYRIPNVKRFASFLETLGLFDDRGRPKEGWKLFQERVPAFAIRDAAASGRG
ncbi:MAG: hypothetical protein GC154_06175 [bacterium]|nr:hypothetical protein [bacterium]